MVCSNVHAPTRQSKMHGSCLIRVPRGPTCVIEHLSSIDRRRCNPMDEGGRGGEDAAMRFLSVLQRALYHSDGSSSSGVPSVKKKCAYKYSIWQWTTSELYQWSHGLFRTCYLSNLGPARWQSRCQWLSTGGLWAIRRISSADVMPIHVLQTRQDRTVSA